MSLNFMGIILCAAPSLLYREFTTLPTLNLLGTSPYPWAAQRTGGQTSGGSTDTPGSVSRTDLKKNQEEQFQKAQMSSPFKMRK